MEDYRSVVMDDDALDEFLGNGGTGVISFPGGEGEPPYSIPVSYGYDPVENHLYFRLALDDDRAKSEFVDGGPVSFVAYEQSDGQWESVVATGELTEVTDAEASSGVLEGLRRVHIPMVDVFERDRQEVTFRFFRLDPDEMAGRVEATSDA